MPFTFSHPALVLPLRSRRLPAAALIVGSMVPDLNYYCHFGRFINPETHTLASTITFALPMGLAVLIVCSLAQNAFVSTLPSPHREALSHARRLLTHHALRRSVAIASALVIGALTHVLWDGCTHKRGWLVERAAWLRLPVAHGYFVYNAMQLASSFVGAVVVLVCYRRWLRKRNQMIVTATTWRSLYWFVVLYVAVTFALRDGPGLSLGLHVALVEYSILIVRCLTLTVLVTLPLIAVKRLRAKSGQRARRAAIVRG